MTDKIKYFILIFIMIFFTSNASANYDKLAYDFNFNDLDGSKLQLSNFKNNVIVVVNVASQCGFTSQYDEIIDVRGAGLLLGIKTKQNNIMISNRLKKNKLLSVPAGDNVIRLAPPLIINKKHVDEAINIIDETLKNLS